MFLNKMKNFDKSLSEEFEEAYPNGGERQSVHVGSKLSSIKMKIESKIRIDDGINSSILTTSLNIIQILMATVQLSQLENEFRRSGFRLSEFIEYWTGHDVTGRRLRARQKHGLQKAVNKLIQSSPEIRESGQTNFNDEDIILYLKNSLFLNESHIRKPKNTIPFSREFTDTEQEEIKEYFSTISVDRIKPVVIDEESNGGKQKRRRKSKAKKSRRKSTKQRKNKKRKTRRRSS